MSQHGGPVRNHRSGQPSVPRCERCENDCKRSGDSDGKPMEPACRSTRCPSRIAHWMMALSILIMIGSGWRIYNASPDLSLQFPDLADAGRQCPPIPSPGTATPGVATAIAWHLAGMWLLGASFLLFVLWGVFSGHFWRDFLPVTPRSFFRDFVAAALFRLEHTLGRYNAVQKVFYWGVDGAHHRHDRLRHRHLEARADLAPLLALFGGFQVRASCPFPRHVRHCRFSVCAFGACRLGAEHLDCHGHWGGSGVNRLLTRLCRGGLPEMCHESDPSQSPATRILLGRADPCSPAATSVTMTLSSPCLRACPGGTTAWKAAIFNPNKLAPTFSGSAGRCGIFATMRGMAPTWRPISTPPIIAFCCRARSRPRRPGRSPSCMPCRR